MDIFYICELAVGKTEELTVDRSLPSVRSLCWRKERQVKLSAAVEIHFRCVQDSIYSTNSWAEWNLLQILLVN